MIFVCVFPTDSDDDELMKVCYVSDEFDDGNLTALFQCIVLARPTI